LTLAAVVAASAAVGAAAIAMFWLRSPAPDTRVARFPLPMTDGRMLTLSRRAVAVSPDGSQIAYAADGRIYLRLVAEAEARPVAGADPGILPTFSPDGRWLVFWAAGTLRRISIAGGVPVTICAVAPAPFDVDWDDSGILFTRSSGRD
jgi:eukaryotic-like serine/threonine-protein kinase